MKRKKWFCGACRKVSYSSESRASDALGRIHDTRGDNYGPRRAYPCPYSNGWHLTSQEVKETA